MKRIDIGQAITILANLGVIAGIIFLAVEIRQNQAVLEQGNAMNLVAVQNSALDRFSGFRKFLLENDELFMIWTNGMRDAELTDIERQKFNELCTEHIFSMVTNHRAYTALDRLPEAENAISNVRGRIATSQTYAACWERQLPSAKRAGYLEFIAGVEAD